MCCMWLTENTGYKNYTKKSPCAHHRTKLSGSGYIFTTKACIDNRKKILNSNISSSWPHNMVNLGPLMPEIGWLVWGTPAHFNEFRVLALLVITALTSLNGGQPNFTRCLAPPGLVHCVYIYKGFCPLEEFLADSEYILVDCYCFSFVIKPLSSLQTVFSC